MQNFGETKKGIIMVNSKVASILHVTLSYLQAAFNMRINCVR